MVSEVLTHLKLKPDSTVIDATVGLGGHAEAILGQIPQGKLLGLDRDAGTLALVRKRLEQFGGQVTLKQANFAGLAEAIPAGFGPVDAILMDLGLSSWQLAERGFSFQTEAPLDLRFDTREQATAAQVLAELPEAELADLIYRFGEERASRRIAKAIVTARKSERITTTTALVDIISSAVPRRGRIHPATKTFQALRIAVNDELTSLEHGLQAAEGALTTGGRLAVITFHSLEDRIVKQHLANSKSLTRVNKKVIQPMRAEIIANPRSRSAKLRVAEKQ